jgi:hypothetical protein
MAADYTHFIHTQQERSEVCAKRTYSHNGGLDFPDSEGSPVSQSLIAALQNPALYPHPVDGRSRSISVFSTSPALRLANTFAPKNCA